MPKVLAVIPARSKSKRFPRKNMRLLLGKPLISYTIKAALKSKFLGKIIVSTDDKEIAKVSKKLGAEVPFIRPAKLAGDKTTSVSVAKHAVRFLERNNIYKPDYIILLEPTSPLRTTDDIDRAISKLIRTGADSVVSVYKDDEYHPIRAKKIKRDRIFDYGIKEAAIKRRQDLNPVYFRNSAIFVTHKNILMNKSTFIGRITRPYIMPKARSIDINDEIDLKVAEMLLKNRR